MQEENSRVAPEDVERVLGEQYASLCTAVSESVANVLNIDAMKVQPSSVLLDLGAQSFDFVDLVFRLERTYDIEIPRTYLVPDAYTVDTLVRVVAHELAARGSKA